MNRRVAARYALALMELGEELKVLDRVADDLRDIEGTIRGSRELTLVLMSPVINPEQKLKVLTEIFGKRCSEMTMKFITLLIRKDRSEYLLGAAEEFLRMLDVKHNILHARIRSAVGLTEVERQQLIAKLERMTGKHVRAEFNADAALRGGFVARVGDDMIDASLKRQLERLREQFAQGGSPGAQLAMLVVFIENSFLVRAMAIVALLLLIPSILLAQSLGSATPELRIHAIPAPGFHPTCNLDSNSVGFYFFPPNLGAKWTLRTISQVLDITNTVLKCDTTYSFERIISDSNRTIQGLPVLVCESSFPYHLGEEDSAKMNIVEYYVDDSVVMTIFNHSITSELNHILLENPLDSGSTWIDVSDDTTKTTVIATKEPVSTPMGDFPQSLVVQTPAGFGTMSKYFVKGVGIVKIVFRGIPPQQNGTFLVTSELVSLDQGNPKRSIKNRFQARRIASKKPVRKSKKHSQINTP